ncbi:hypothetical protein Bsp3421_000153 (plasmid) [Burkholderia sp. FERM BP-3421]|uniref:hypothetical protein n=1 Tax=Burkholderia sp. FERM BP-3421 TaxID=1494466 RepID=UPI00235EBF6E|nr:hypothetical protein [Burkholderia sp. FERM BP-3421]WDD90328.1 hypothetical protein Bsp3421_000153 [Burkholderia sp. FERM BP-3421]
MGQAKQRGAKEQRIAQAQAKIEALRPEKLVCGACNATFTERYKNLFDVPRIKFPEPLAFLTSLSNSLQHIRSFDAIKVDTAKTADEIVAMSREGWYVDGKMGVTRPRIFKTHMDDGKPAEAEALMVEHFTRRCAGIHAEMVAAYPARRAILDQAFAAHANGQYLLSIPTLLTQVDGICADALQASFFLRGDRQKAIREMKVRAGSGLALAYLAPLDTDMSIAMSESSRPADFSALNRHMVLHGESTDHGTLANSLRTISLLNFIAQAIERDPPQIASI